MIELTICYQWISWYKFHNRLKETVPCTKWLINDFRKCESTYARRFAIGRKFLCILLPQETLFATLFSLFSFSSRLGVGDGVPPRSFAVIFPLIRFITFTIHWIISTNFPIFRKVYPRFCAPLLLRLFARSSIYVPAAMKFPALFRFSRMLTFPLPSLSDPQ